MLRVTWAAALASGLLAPLVLVASFAALFGPHNGSVGSLSGFAWSALPAALLGAHAVHRSHRNIGRVLAWSALSGVLYLASALVLGSYTLGTANLLNTIALSLLLAVFGSVISAPTGFLFGLLFLLALTGQPQRLSRPSQDAPSEAAFAASRMLLVATVIACLFLLVLDVTEASSMLGLGPDVPPWVGIAIPAPTALGSLLFALVGMHEKRANQALRHLIARGTHPEYYPGDIAPGEDAIPLTAEDRKHTPKRLLVRRDASAYRGGEGSVQVYVGIA